MNNIEDIVVYSTQPFLYELFVQCTNYKTHTMNSLKKLEELVSTKFSLIIDSQREQVNWKYIDLFNMNLKLIVWLYEATDSFKQVTNNIFNQSSIYVNIPIIYLAKPFKFGKLTSIIDRYSSNNQDNLILSNNYSFSYVNKLIIKSGSTLAQNTTVSLTEKEAALLRFLYNAQGEPISKTEILERIWGYTNIIDTHTLETHIYRLRQKLEKDAYIIYTHENKYGLKRHDF